MAQNSESSGDVTRTHTELCIDVIAHFWFLHVLLLCVKETQKEQLCVPTGIKIYCSSNF